MVDLIGRFVRGDKREQNQEVFEGLTAPILRHLYCILDGMRQRLRWFSLNRYPCHAAFPEHIQYWYNRFASLADCMSLQCVSNSSGLRC